MKILITGSTGQLGTTLQKILPVQNYTVIALDRTHCDITDKKTLRQIFITHQPQWVINTAAYTAVDRAETEQQQAYDVNVSAVRNLAEECERTAAKLIHFSTDYVFPGDSSIPYVETDVCGPKSIYGKTKLLGEQEIQNTFDNYLIMRVSWLFSAYGHNFLKTIVRLLQEKEFVKIVNDQHGCPTYTNHIAQVIRTIMNEQTDLTGIFHYCDQPVTTWQGFANHIQECLIDMCGQTEKEIIGIPTSEYPTPATRPVYSVLNCNKLYQATGITPYDWRNGVKTIIEEKVTA